MILYINTSKQSILGQIFISIKSVFEIWAKFARSKLFLIMSHCHVHVILVEFHVTYSRDIMQKGTFWLKLGEK